MTKNVVEELTADDKRVIARVAVKGQRKHGEKYGPVLVFKRANGKRKAAKAARKANRGVYSGQ